MYTCFFYLFLITLWSALVGLTNNLLRAADTYALIFFVVLWFFANLLFAVRAVILLKQERASLNYDTSDLKKFYRSRRSGNDRSTIECKFNADKLIDQEDDGVLLFSGRKLKQGIVTPQMFQKKNELLRLGTFLVYDRNVTSAVVNAESS
ncbi:hypothetical protein RFI_09966 [Reticulomyxa filosa]|uniref:Uncharacterized protein n=1 Tax=Reticulomyxa filosa TaxID=46433 RepID=X6NMC1_RETFI|nr:hypothetical protein RFI_09966 [Reticulomyxa filosa]|eukprot:ETO27166.1 hypothetical protein RFI_09966 [Reticulomyxa filosa]